MSAFAVEQMHLRLRARASAEYEPYPLDVPAPGGLPPPPLVLNVSGENEARPRSEDGVFPFPPEPPAPGSQEDFAGDDLDFAMPWSLLQTVQEVPQDSLTIASFDPPSPSYVPSEGQEQAFSDDGERAWYSPVAAEPEPEDCRAAMWPSRPSVDEEPHVPDPLHSDQLGVQVRQQALLDFVKRRRTSLAFPWERQPSAVHEAYKLRFQAVPQVGIRECISTLEPEVPAPSDASAVSWKVATRLRRIKIPLGDDELRAGALKRLKVLVLLDPEGTQLGLSLLQKTLALKDDDDIRQSLSDAFRGKASTTLQKRALSLQALAAKHLEMHEGSPWRMTEDQLYAILCAFRAAGAKPSTANHILEALRFFDGVCKLLYTSLDSVISSRSRGVARELYLQKAPLRQRDPLRSEQVQGLERLMMSGIEDWLKVILGLILFCVHACCRWSDSQRIKSLQVLGEGPGAILFAQALGSKTSLTAEAQTRFLPYTAVARGVADVPWADEWLAARSRESLDFQVGCVPTWLVSRSRWGSVPMSTDEAGDFLQDLLARAGTGADANMSIGTHSCKATLLTWTTWSPIVTFSPKEQRHLGHHLKRGQSTLTYSREYFVTLCGKVLGMYRTIRSGRFNPDESPSQRAVAIADGYDRETPGEVSPDPQALLGGGPGSAADRRLNDTEPFGDSDDGSASAESCVEKPDGARKPPVGGRLPFDAEDDRELKIHRLSGIVHRVREGNVLICGRQVNERYRAFSADDEDEPEVCQQCARGLT